MDRFKQQLEPYQDLNQSIHQITWAIQEVNDFDYESVETLEVLNKLYQTPAKQLTAKEAKQNEDLTLLYALYEQIMPADTKELVSVKEQIEIVLN